MTRAGGLGLIGGGYPDAEWLQRQIDRAEGARVGYGFITRSLARNPGCSTSRWTGARRR